MKTVSVSRRALERQAQAIAPMFIGAVMRIYDGERPPRPEDGAGGSKLLVEMLFPQQVKVDGWKIVAGPLQPSVGLAKGRLRWFRIHDTGGGVVLDGDCGVRGSGSACEVAHATIDEGQPCVCSIFVHDVDNDTGEE